jgi:LacI family transcriptional regulator
MASSQITTRATISDVAERAGVSIATVSRVINDSDRVTQKTLTRVREAISALNYSPHGAARRLASGRSGTLGLLFPEITGNFMIPLLRGIETAAHEHDRDLVIHSTNRPPSESSMRSRPVGEHNTDGLLIFPASVDDAELTRLHRLHFPVVLLHQTPPPGLMIPYVTFENKTGSRKLIDHLIEAHDRHRIAFLKGPEEHEDSLWRERGYRQSIDVHHISYDPALGATGGFNASIASAAVERWLAEGVQFDAIFTGDDDSAFGVLQTLHEHGILVPEQVAVVGFDDVPFSQFTDPPRPPYTPRSRSQDTKRSSSSSN